MSRQSASSNRCGSNERDPYRGTEDRKHRPRARGGRTYDGFRAIVARYSATQQCQPRAGLMAMAGGRSTAAQRGTAASEAPPPASPARPPSRVERIADFVGSAARWARRMGPASGWFLIGLAAFVMAHALPGGEPMPRNMPAAAPQPVPAPSAALPASSTSPAGVPVAQLGQLSEPSGSIANRMAGRNQHIPAKWLASRRSRLVVRRAYPFLVYRSAPGVSGDLAAINATTGRR